MKKAQAVSLILDTLDQYELKKLNDKSPLNRTEEHEKVAQEIAKRLSGQSPNKPSWLNHLQERHNVPAPPSLTTSQLAAQRSRNGQLYATEPLSMATIEERYDRQVVSIIFYDPENNALISEVVNSVASFQEDIEETEDVVIDALHEISEGAINRDYGMLVDVDLEWDWVLNGSYDTSDRGRCTFLGRLFHEQLCPNEIRIVLPVIHRMAEISSRQLEPNPFETAPTSSNEVFPGLEMYPEATLLKDVLEDENTYQFSIAQQARINQFASFSHPIYQIRSILLRATMKALGFPISNNLSNGWEFVDTATSHDSVIVYLRVRDSTGPNSRVSLVYDGLEITYLREVARIPPLGSLPVSFPFYQAFMGEIGNHLLSPTYAYLASQNIRRNTLDRAARNHGQVPINIVEVTASLAVRACNPLYDINNLSGFCTAEEVGFFDENGYIFKLSGPSSYAGCVLSYNANEVTFFKRLYREVVTAQQARTTVEYIPREPSEFAHLTQSVEEIRRAADNFAAEIRTRS